MCADVSSRQARPCPAGYIDIADSFAGSMGTRLALVSFGTYVRQSKSGDEGSVSIIVGSSAES